MQTDRFYGSIVQPALAFLTAITGIASDDRAHLLVMAIPGQESGWRSRLQVPVAYARSYWQMERGGMVAGLLSHHAAKPLLLNVLDALDVPPFVDTVFEAVAWHDTLACCMARLGLWVDPKPLPAVDDVQGSWQYYLDNWRPGAPRPDAWAANHAVAKALVFPQSTEHKV